MYDHIFTFEIRQKWEMSESTTLLNMMEQPDAFISQLEPLLPNYKNALILKHHFAKRNDERLREMQMKFKNDSGYREAKQSLAILEARNMDTKVRLDEAERKWEHDRLEPERCIRDNAKYLLEAIQAKLHERSARSR